MRLLRQKNAYKESRLKERNLYTEISNKGEG
jgi:hypothetical protein